MRRALIGPVVVALIGLLMVGLGVYLLTTAGVECEIGREMRPGEVCVTQRPGRAPISLTYEEQRASNKRIGVIAVGVGALAIGYGAWTLWKEARRPRPQ